MFIAKQKYSKLSQQAGFGLIEVMVALVMSLVLVLGATQLYLSTKQSTRITDNMSRLQENGRFALDFISRDLRRAGAMGCQSDTRLNEVDQATGNITQTNVEVLINNATDYLYDFTSGIGGFSSPVGATGWAPVLPPTIPASITPLDGTDVLVIRGESGNAVSVTANVGGVLQIDPTNEIAAGDIVVASNCDLSSIFQVTSDPATGVVEHNTTGIPGNTTNILGANYIIGNPINKLSTITYFIGTGQSGAPALFRQIDQTPAQELIPDVENLKLLFGEVIGNNIRYVTADQVTPVVPAMSNVNAIRMALLLRAPEITLPPNETRQYALLNDTASFTDGFARQVYTSTVVLRNRLR